VRKTVAVDLDGVIARYDKWVGLDHFGDPLPGSREFLTTLRAQYNVLIFTTRCCEELAGGEKAPFLVKRVREYLEKHDLPYDEIWAGQGKPIYVALVDDRSISCRPQVDSRAFEKTLEKVRELAGVASGTDDIWDEESLL